MTEHFSIKFQKEIAFATLVASESLLTLRFWFQNVALLSHLIRRKIKPVATSSIHTLFTALCEDYISWFTGIPTRLCSLWLGLFCSLVRSSIGNNTFSYTAGSHAKLDGKTKLNKLGPRGEKETRKAQDNTVTNSWKEMQKGKVDHGRKREWLQQKTTVEDQSPICPEAQGG